MSHAVPPSVPDVTIRPLSTLEEFAMVVELEREIWGSTYDDVVPVTIFAITVMRGGILLGAFDGGRLVGFVYSLPAIKNGRPTQWSHMLGIAQEYRRGGLGRELKLRQRERAMAAGQELIEWTFDPLQAVNAHLNFVRLGVVAHEYEVNVYGESSSPLHGGNPTDRLIAEWWLASPRVVERIGGRAATANAGETVAVARPVNTTSRAGHWLEPGPLRLHSAGEPLRLDVPTGFTEMLARAPELALAWRVSAREAFVTLFSRGYRAVDFSLDVDRGLGSYLLVGAGG